jgi:hypothetical protein
MGLPEAVQGSNLRPQLLAIGDVLPLSHGGLQRRVVLTVLAMMDTLYLGTARIQVFNLNSCPLMITLNLQLILTTT